jgi:hypothetical protein
MLIMIMIIIIITISSSAIMRLLAPGARHAPHQRPELQPAT